MLPKCVDKNILYFEGDRKKMQDKKQKYSDLFMGFENELRISTSHTYNWDWTHSFGSLTSQKSTQSRIHDLFQH